MSPRGIELVRPLHVPKSCESLKRAFADESLRDALERVHEAAASGVPGARAIIGCLALRGVPDGEPDAALAVDVCAPDVERGDSYAQYITGEALLAQGKMLDAIPILMQSATQGFLPAMGEMGVLFAMNHADNENAANIRKGARWMFTRAVLRGYWPALAQLCGIWQHSSRAWGVRVLGHVLEPIALLLMLPPMLLTPYSQRIFMATVGRSASQAQPP
ncbi:MAG: hypothetical protein R3E77_10345 [Steroidobacteraceae bacterium]